MAEAAGRGRGRGRGRGAGPPAVLFDLDGTLADTEAMWRDAYARLATEEGVVLDPGWWAAALGRDLGDAATALLGPELAPPGDRDHLVARLIDLALATLEGGQAPAEGDASGAVTWRPGAEKLVTELARHGVPSAVVTASPRRLLDAVVHHLGIEVDVTVAGDEVARAKPDPEGYRRAARLLGVDVRAAVVVEDSPTGVAAAEASGARVLVVPHGVEVVGTPARTVVRSLSEVSVATLATLPSS